MQSRRPFDMPRLPKVFAMVSVVVVGCSGGGDTPDLYEVSGTVTMDGEPLQNATVQFVPKGGEGRPSWGMTDENGYYELGYSGDTMGAIPGEHTVKISTFREAEEDPETGEMSESSQETVPDVYRTPDKLVVTVSSDGQTIDFALNSDESEITQPEFQSELYVTPEEFE